MCSWWPGDFYYNGQKRKCVRQGLGAWGQDFKGTGCFSTRAKSLSVLMDLETKEAEAGPANPHHSHDHSQSLPFVHHIMTNSRFRTSWGKNQLLLAIFWITLTAERVICLNIALSKKRLLLSAPACPPNYDHNQSVTLRNFEIQDTTLAW